MNDSATAAAVVATLRTLLAPAGRDARLLDTQALLTPATAPRLYEGEFTPTAPPLVAGARPEIAAAVAAMRGDARPGLATAAALTRAVARLRAIPFDGRDRAEEDALRSGEATPLERARLLALLAQAAGLGARLCLLYRPGMASDFHAVAELWIMNAWSVFDPLAGQSYLRAHRGYATAWELNRAPVLVDQHPEHGRKPTIDSSWYRTIGIVNLDTAG